MKTIEFTAFPRNYILFLSLDLDPISESLLEVIIFMLLVIHMVPDIFNLTINMRS